MIEVDERFEVPASPEVVWRLLSDPYAVVGCVPGAAIVGQGEDGSLDTTLTVKFGPLSIGFQARAELQLDAAQRRGTLIARGKDKQGGARFQASATFSVADDAAATVTAPAIDDGGQADATSDPLVGGPVDPAASDVPVARDVGAAASQLPVAGGVSAAALNPPMGTRANASSLHSVVTVEGEVDLSGRLASMIEAGAGVIVKRMAAQFAECLRARCAAAAT